MGNITVTRPDSRVNLGARPERDTSPDIPVTITITLSPAEAQTICGPGQHTPEETARLVNEFVTDWLSPSIAALGDELEKRATGHRTCRTCTGPLVGSEIRRGVCGHCSRRVRL